MVGRCKAAMPTEMLYWAVKYVSIFLRSQIEWLIVISANPNLV